MRKWITILLTLSLLLTLAACGKKEEAPPEEDIPAQGHDFVQDAYGDYYCRNELDANNVPTLVVSAAVKEGYEAVTLEEKVTAGTACQTEEAARQYASQIVEDALVSVGGPLQYEVHTVSYTPPTRTVDGEYVYQVTIQPAGRAAAGGLTTEPLYIVLPATGGTEPDPDPTPTPPPTTDPEPAPDTGREETYLISIPQFSGGKVVSSPRYAAQGGRVTLTVYPEEGYTLSKLTVTDARGRDVSLRDLEDGRFSFTMPGSRVEVNAVFEASDTGDGEAGPGPGAERGAARPGRHRQLYQRFLLRPGPRRRCAAGPPCGGGHPPCLRQPGRTAPAGAVRVAAGLSGGGGAPAGLRLRALHGHWTDAPARRSGAAQHQPEHVSAGASA